MNSSGIPIQEIILHPILKWLCKWFLTFFYPAVNCNLLLRSFLFDFVGLNAINNIQNGLTFYPSSSLITIDLMTGVLFTIVDSPFTWPMTGVLFTIADSPFTPLNDLLTNDLMTFFYIEEPHGFSPPSFFVNISLARLSASRLVKRYRAILVRDIF